MIYTVTLSPARDRSICVNGFAPGKLNRAVSVRDDPGGKGINVSKLIHVLDGRSTALCVLGGETGRYIERALKDMGIDVEAAFSEHETRTNIKVFDTASGETTDINENAHADPEAAGKLFDRLQSVVRSGDICVFAGKIDTSSADIAAWIRTLKAAGVKVFLDTEGEALRQGAAASPYMIKPNEYELAEICGSVPLDENALAQAALSLSDTLGIDTVFISLGSRGALAARGGRVYAALTAPRVRVQCTTGAGDAVTAALAYAEETHMPFEAACRLSMACGAASVMMPGTQSPEKSLILSLINDVEIRRLL
ncbi:MAG: 1-phosphofructokinase family hexose kinase [Clostridia bacterium]|nr:1-phosphofructokinase family hexose kinase [Clostridia bacterium]